MNKKIGTMIMAGVMACTMTATLAFSGCKTVIPDFDMPEGGYDGSAVEIMFYNTMGQNLRGVLDSAITRFNALYPNITVKYDPSSGDYDTLRDKIKLEVQNGVQPNIAFCYPDHVALYNQAGAVVVLDDFLPGGAFKDMTVTQADGKEVPLGLTQEQKDDFIEAYYEEGAIFGDGKMYTLPFAKSTEVLYYNKTFFDAHEELTEPTSDMTWEQIFALCAEIKKIDSNCVPLGIDSESNLFITLCEQSNSPYTSATGEHFLFDNDVNRAFVQKFHDWYQSGYFTTETINKSYTSNLFKEQKSYMSIGSSAGAQYQAPDVKDGKADFEVGIVSIPQINPEKPKSISQGPSVCIFKQENPQEVIASWLFVKFLTTEIQFQAMYSETSGYVPVLKSVFENQVYQDHLASANGYLDGITALSAKTCKALVEENAYYTSPAFIGSSKARDEVGILMVAALTETKTIDKAFRDAIDECRYFAG